MEAVWNFLNGKKTVIAAVLLVVSAFLEQVVIGQWGVSSAVLPKVIATLDWFGMILGGFGLSHKGIKVIKNGNG